MQTEARTEGEAGTEAERWRKGKSEPNLASRTRETSGKSIY